MTELLISLRSVLQPVTEAQEQEQADARGARGLILASSAPPRTLRGFYLAMQHDSAAKVKIDEYMNVPCPAVRIAIESIAVDGLST